MAQSNQSRIPTPATPDVCTVKILIDGTEIPGIFHIAGISVTRELGRIPAATIHLQDGEPSLATFEASNSDHFIPGKKVQIKLGYNGQEDSVFKGIVIKNSIKIRPNGSFLIVECRDEAVKMTNASQSSYYVNKKDSTILEEVVGRHGLQKDITPTTPALKEVVQYDTTDWDFLLCRAEANGMLVAVEDGKVRVIKPDASQTPVLTVQYGAVVLELDAEMDARNQFPGLKAKAWAVADQVVVEATAKEPITTNNGNLSPSVLSGVLGGSDREIRHGGHLSKPELQAWADGRLLKNRFAKVRGRVRFQGFADILPGKILEIKGIGDRFEGKVLVAGVRHSVAGGNWETDVQFGLNPEPVAETYNLRPMPAAGLVPGVSGLQIGVVTALESDPDGEDRIQVRLPLVSTQADGIWARIATLDAGNERGTFFRPEIGDEVVVGFISDDPRYPIILGACHSSAKPAPEPAKDDNHHKGYVSREKLKMTFDDDKKSLAFETPGGNKLTLSDDAKGIKIEDQNGNKITLDDKGVTIESAKDITIKVSKDLKVEGMNIELKAQTGFKAEGAASAEISGASTNVKGSATTVIKGGIVQIN
jgi:Rhs element Vgr protein